MEKQERNGVSKTLFCLSDVLLQRNDSAWANLGKNTFLHSWQLYTVTQDDFELRKAAQVFGWWWGVERGPTYVGWPRIKRSLFKKKILESQNHREKLIL
jgi:hypothetical protein